MRVMLLTLLGSSFLLAPMAATQQGGAADLCQELRVYAEKKAAEPPKGEKAAEQGKPAGGNRGDSEGSGTQGGGSTNQSSSTDTSKQASAPPTAPVSSGDRKSTRLNSSH